jgi:Na+/H+ antiporter NhaC
MEPQTAQVTYGALALVPAIVAIGLAVWKRQVVASLFAGLWIGATIIHNWNPFMGLLDSFSKYIVSKALADAWNIGVITFCLAIGGMIGVMSRIGGTKAIADALVTKAKDTKSTLLTTMFMGLAIFFDDYANSMIVGNTMRPLTDKHKISREKLAYIVDSTAAPVSCTCPISTWVAMELGLITAALAGLGIKANAMMVFLDSVPFRFYSIFAVAFVFIIILQKRDFGNMLKAEIRAKKTGQVFAEGSNPLMSEDKDLLPPEGVTGSIWHAIIPIGLFMVTTVLGLWYSGYGEGKTIRECFGDADASVVLTWAAFMSSFAAIFLGIISKKLTLEDGVESWVKGTKTMMTAVIILTLAFALKGVIDEMGLASWLVEVTKDSLSGAYLPALTFVLAFGVAFATGTSWGADAILMPIIIPIAASVSGATDMVTPLMVSSIGAVLTGAVCGDHCSPISDTTILSSMASGSDHVDHVRTQMPYALTVAGFALVFGYLPAGFGAPVWLSLILGIVGMAIFVKFVGKQVSPTGEIIGEEGNEEAYVS